jgi:hypothetical protein
MSNAPTVGRKMHFFPAGDTSVRKYDAQPIDATVIYVWPKADGSQPQLVNLLTVDHGGTIQPKTSVPVINEGDEIPMNSFYARWPAITETPQADANALAPTAAPAADATDSSSAASAEPPTIAPVAPTAESQSADASAPAPSTATAKVEQPVAYGFDEAVRALKAGKAAMRRGWNGKGMFVYMVPAGSYKAQTGIAKAYFGEEVMVPYNAYLAIKNVDGTVSTWVPSVNDVLAEDWEISK